jgi:hypothetical protein
VVSEKAKLTTKQLKAIPILLAAKSYEQGCKAAKISKATFYAWMQDEGFAAEFERQRDEIVEAAFGLIAQNIEKAVSTLVGLLNSKDERVKRLTANDVIDFIIRHKENEDLDKRLTEIEKRLAQEPKR